MRYQVVNGVKQRQGSKVIIVQHGALGLHLVPALVECFQQCFFGGGFGRKQQRLVYFKFIFQQIGDRHVEDCRQLFYMVDGELREVVFDCALGVLRNAHARRYIFLRIIFLFPEAADDEARHG